MALWDPQNGPIGPYNGPVGPYNGPMGCGGNNTALWGPKMTLWDPKMILWDPKNGPIGPQKPMGPQKWPYRTPKMAPWDVGGSTWLYETLK